MAMISDSMLVVEMKNVALPVFIFTLIVVTSVLIWGLRILQGVLTRPDPDNPNLKFIDKALSEKMLTHSGEQPSENNVPSSSRLGAAVGVLVLAIMALGVGYYMLWSLFTKQTVDLSSVGTYFLSGSALFAPYAFNQLSSIFKGGN
jgi:hypothetical protein